MAASIGTSTGGPYRIEHPWQPKVNRSFLHVFIPTFELLFVVIRRPTAQSLRASDRLGGTYGFQREFRILF